MESMVVFYPCLDIEETSAFYQQVIGLKLAQDQGKCRIFDTGYGYLGFVEYEDHILATKTCISFNLTSVEEVNQRYEALVKQGIKVNTVPQRHPVFAVYSFFLNDPNGYTLEYQKIIE